jgi:ubiquinone/menaquinone biosynthesis C-methylase UbiE
MNQQPEGNAAPDYVWGQSCEETRRLMLQSQILRPITARLLACAQIREGMRVLDLGCGAGDVSMLAAELVGPAGSVVGVDRDPNIVALASERARAAGQKSVFFQTASVDHLTRKDLARNDMTLTGPFDAVIGRYILHHLPDPVETVRRAAELLAPGGVLAFHEIAANIPSQSNPEVLLVRQMSEWVVEMFRRTGGAQFDAATRLVGIFQDAGLPAPNVFGELIVGGGPGSPVYPWLAATLRSIAPRIVELGFATEKEIDIDTFEQRLEAAVLEFRSQVVVSPQYCAWGFVDAARDHLAGPSPLS